MAFGRSTKYSSLSLPAVERGEVKVETSSDRKMGGGSGCGWIRVGSVQY